MDVIDTPRLRLRPVEPGDGPAIVAALDDLAVSRWLSVVPHPYTRADFEHYLANVARPGRSWTIIEDGRFAGLISLEDHLGYWLMPAAQGRGLATEAARAVLAEVFLRSDDPVTSGHFSDNDRSGNVLRKLGFRETGRGPEPCRALGAEREHVDMKLTRGDYVAALPVEARSARLTYRALQPTDRDALHAIVSQRAVTRQLGHRWPWPADPDYTLTRSRPYRGDGFVWGIFRDGHLIGTIGITEGEIGYLLDPAWHRQGLAEEACRLVLDRAFGPMGLAAVRAGVWADNAASLGLLAKLGFTITGGHDGTSALRPRTAPGHDLILTRATWQACRART